MSTADRVLTARTKIQRRRDLAKAASPGPWGMTTLAASYGGLVSLEGEPRNDTERDGYGGRLVGESISEPDRSYLALNDPAHVLAVLDNADQTLDRHAQHSDIGLADGDWCPADGWDYPCPDLQAVLDLYAPLSVPA